ncbi:type II secretion system protein GspD [Oceaniovalibus sp. ACAM 378]|nr:type II secretion system protein GspD [Oceaniovalibus sp. ACAM 378]
MHSPVQAQSTETFVINLRDAEINLLAEQVSDIMSRTLVLDPTLGGTVTVVSKEKLDREGVWALFQSILRVRGFTAVETGSVWQVIPEDRARTRGGADSADTGSQDVVTRLLRLKRLPASEAVRVLRPLIDASGYIEAIEDPNAIVVTDTQDNVDRIISIATTFDGEAEMEAEVIRFTYANAATVANAITEVLGAAGTGARLSVDAGSNVLLVRGTQRDMSQIRNLARSMDVSPRVAPSETVSTAIFRLQYGEAAVIAELVRNTLTGSSGLVNPVAVSLGEGENGTEPQPGFSEDAAPIADVSVQASIETNAVIVRGTQRQLSEVGQLIKALDVRRPQVMIEAAIVEVSGEVAERLGVQLGLGPNIPSGSVAATSFGNGGGSLQNILVALGQTSGSALSTGLSVGLATDSFGALIQALNTSSSANLLSTPSVTTMDNQAATIVVGQNVPFRTGRLTTDGGNVAEVIERQDVGITMNVKPRITAGGVVELEIEQEVSSLSNQAITGAADLVTNRRVINTTVLAENGGTVVLGGLITDDQLLSNQKVPGLGDVPILGNLFKSRNNSRSKRTLFVFLRPTIMLSRDDLERAAQTKYRRAQNAEITPQPRTLLREEKVRKLPLEIGGLY